MGDFWNENLNEIPYNETVLVLQDDGNVHQDIMYDESIAEYKLRRRSHGGGRDVIAWASVPPLRNATKEQS